MKSINDLWEDMGKIHEDDYTHVLTKLFITYEANLKNNPQDTESKNFFQHLDNAMSQTSECNLNRR